MCVIVRGRPEWMPTAGGSQVLPNDNAQLPPPSYVGFGRRARSLMSDEGRQEVVAGDGQKKTVRVIAPNLIPVPHAQN